MIGVTWLVTRFKNFKVGSPSKFKELSLIFEGCIGTPAYKFEILKAPPANVPFDIQMYADMFMGNTTEISTHAPRTLHIHVVQLLFFLIDVSRAKLRLMRMR